MLIGLRRIGTADAFDELIGAARRHGVSVLAEALVALASGNEPPDPVAARALDGMGHTLSALNRTPRRRGLRSRVPVREVGPTSRGDRVGRSFPLVGHLAHRDPARTRYRGRGWNDHPEEAHTS
ncbi:MULTISPECIES: hypothetical protein [unclassified Rhodococcus (in: high G+C Gram-positive bacteria)]|uniref:hypothetical protein n=1 Tax=unclassified Rhodococcus (in: high G+C Gram-positive bacteria) TaxID=192944 RepID=UPI0020787DB9|nr:MULTISPECIES: hypothetical protein [unclassified Rhodococcus (in: high G+C Gram-positive bacteria)]